MTDKSAMERKKVFNDFYFNVGRALIQMEEETRRLLSDEQSKTPTDMAGLVEDRWMTEFKEYFSSHAVQGKWKWGVWNPKSMEEALLWYKETLEKGNGLEQHLVLCGEDDAFVCITGNGPHSEAHAKILCELPEILSRYARPTSGQEGKDMGGKDGDELEYILAQVDYELATGSGFELETLYRFKKLVECAVARKNAISAYWLKKGGKLSYKAMSKKMAEYGKIEEELTKNSRHPSTDKCGVKAENEEYKSNATHKVCNCIGPEKCKDKSCKLVREFEKEGR